MIAVSSSGTGFRALATYLVHGRTGLEEGRIGWASARNLPTNDPELAATFMRATASQNVRVEKSLYHLVLAFDPGDPVDRATMELVADRVLARLGLEEHQSLIVSHWDREHPHLHVLVNRVHPETGKVWDRWQDMPAIQEMLRSEERALRLREVPGHLHVREVDREVRRGLGAELSQGSSGGDGWTREASAPRPLAESDRIGMVGRAPSERVVGSAAPASEAERAADARTLVARAREVLPAVRASGGWDDVERTLGEAGLRLEGRGSGLVVTDGERYAKASSIGPDLTLRRLEARLGRRTPEPGRTGLRADEGTRTGGRPPADGVALGRSGAGEEGEHRDARAVDAHRVDGDRTRVVRSLHDVPVPVFAPIVDAAPASPLERIAREVAQLEHVREFAAAQRGAAQALSAERARLAALDAAVERRDRTHSALDAAFARVYVEPVRARTTFNAAACAESLDRAAARLRDRPEAFGALAAAERKHAFGLMRQRDEAVARRAAREAGALALEWAAAERGLAAAMGPGRGGASAPVAVQRSHVGSERVRRAAELEAAMVRERTIAVERRGLPAVEVLERGLHEAMRKLTPSEVQQLQVILTRPQAALVQRLRQTMREAVLGLERDG